MLALVGMVRLRVDSGRCCSEAVTGFSALTRIPAVFAVLRSIVGDEFLDLSVQLPDQYRPLLGAPRTADRSDTVLPRLRRVVISETVATDGCTSNGIGPVPAGAIRAMTHPRGERRAHQPDP
jgi:hypothetical protein